MNAITYRCGKFRVEVANRRLLRGDVEIPLEPKAFAVLVELLARAGNLVTRDQLLDAVWGHRYVTPATVNRVITLVRRALGDHADTPCFIDTVHGAGYRYIGPFERHEAGASATIMRFEPPAVARLPARVTTLIGRERELQQLHELLDSHRTVTVVGAGGMGKTQCAYELARRLRPSFPDGVWVFDLVPFNDKAQLLHALAAMFSIPADAVAEVPARVCEIFRERCALLLFDNCERLAQSVGEVVLELLRNCEHVSVLATSQQRLNFVGEHLMNMPPLSVPEEWLGDTHDLTNVGAAAAVELLMARARAVAPDFALTLDNVGTIVSMCRRLDGMPLALELAAVQLARFSPDDVLGQLDHRFRFLSSGETGRENRHQTLHALLSWSFSLCSDVERRLLIALGVFAHGWTAEGAEYVGAALGFDSGQVLDLLGSLVNKSFVTLDPSCIPSRYRLLESIRAFSLERLLESDLYSLVRNTHVEYYVQLSQRSHEEILRPTQANWNARLIHEHADIAAAVNWASTHGEANAALRLTGNLMLYCKSYGVVRDGVAWCRQALSRDAVLDSTAGVRALLALGVLVFHKAEPSTDQVLSTAIELTSKHRDDWALAFASAYLACQLAGSDRLVECAAAVAVARKIASVLGDPLLQGVSSIAHAFLCLAQNRESDAVAVLTPACDLGSDLHQRHFANTYLGLAHFGLGDWQSASAAWLLAMTQALELGHVRGTGGCIEGYAYLVAQQALFADAAWALGAADAIRKRTAAPLLRLWHAHHQKTFTMMQTALGEIEFQRHYHEGGAARYEIVVSRVYDALERYVRQSPLHREISHENSP